MRVLHLSEDDCVLLAEAASAVSGLGNLRVAIDTDGFKFSLNGGTWTTGRGITDPHAWLEVSCGSCGQVMAIYHDDWHKKNRLDCYRAGCGGSADLVHARRHADDPCHDDA